MTGSFDRLRSMALDAFIERVIGWLLDGAMPRDRNGSRKRIFDATVTFLLFLRQTLCRHRSCQTVVAEYAMALEKRDGKRISLNTSGYCQARSRLEGRAIMEALRSVTDKVERFAGRPDLRWCGRDVLVADGTCLTLPDTAENRKAFPLSRSVKPGCGFPQLRMEAIFSLATGAMVAHATGSIRRGEMSLFLDLADTFKAGDVVLGDRKYCSTSHLHFLRERGVDLVTRAIDARVRRRVVRQLGKGDHLVAWARPLKRPEWMDKAMWEAFPEEILVREIDGVEDRSGFRPTKVRVVTTLLDAEAYPAREFIALYLRRWEAELNLRDLKVTLGLDQLSCLTPAMVEKEIATCVFGYNVVRGLMLMAAEERGVSPRELSFSVSARLFREAMFEWSLRDPADPAFDFPAEVRKLVGTIGRATLRNSRARERQPRAIKRRPKFPFLTKPRGEYEEVRHRNRVTGSVGVQEPKAT